MAEEDAEERRIKIISFRGYRLDGGVVVEGWNLIKTNIAGLWPNEAAFHMCLSENKAKDEHSTGFLLNRRTVLNYRWIWIILQKGANLHNFWKIIQPILKRIYLKFKKKYVTFRSPIDLSISNRKDTPKRNLLKYSRHSFLSYCRLNFQDAHSPFESEKREVSHSQFNINNTLLLQQYNRQYQHTRRHISRVMWAVKKVKVQEGEDFAIEVLLSIRIRRVCWSACVELDVVQTGVLLGVFVTYFFRLIISLSWKFNIAISPLSSLLCHGNSATLVLLTLHVRNQMQCPPLQIVTFNCIETSLDEINWLLLPLKYFLAICYRGAFFLPVFFMVAEQHNCPVSNGHWVQSALHTSTNH